MLSKKESLSLRTFYNKAAVWVYCESSFSKNEDSFYFRISKDMLNDIKKILGNDNYYKLTVDLHELAYVNKKDRQKKFHLDFDKVLNELNISKITWNYNE